MNKTTRLCFTLITLFLNLGFAQYQTFSRANNGTNAIIIPSGEVWQVVNWNAQGGGSTYFSLQVGGENKITFNGTDARLVTLESPSSPVGLIIQGPSQITPEYFALQSYYMYFLAVKKLQTTGSSNSVSATSVVIPSSAAGDVDIKLEQSADNVTWTECLPGTYNSSTVKRFFRLRAVEK
jgi:hypothetical protein